MIGGRPFRLEFAGMPKEVCELIKEGGALQKKTALMIEEVV
jgi:hypothetical protein